jgi:hypothetical protein
MRVLVSGWFSLRDGGATAGDLLVRDVVCWWLARRDIAFDVAQPAVHGPGVDWFRVAPGRYSHLILACGPVGPDLDVAMIVERFAAARRIALNVSLVGPGAWRPFNVELERDGAGRSRPDLALAAEFVPAAPVVARVEIHAQQEYTQVRPQPAHSAFDRLLETREAAAFHLDTRLDPSVSGRRSPVEITSLLRRADVVLTTRLHGLVLALNFGIPAIAVDPVVGGAKVIGQARVLGWPAATTVDALDDALLMRWFDWCLTKEAREQAATSAATGRRGLVEVEAELDRALRPQPEGSVRAAHRRFRRIKSRLSGLANAPGDGGQSSRTSS